MKGCSVIGSMALLLLAASVCRAGEPQRVVVQPIAELLMSQAWDVPARVVALNDSAVAARRSAAVEQIHVRVGDRVAKGALLVSLDCRSAQIGLRQARAQQKVLAARLRLARQQKKRAERLLKERSGAQELVDQRRAELASAEAESLGQQARIQQFQDEVADCQVGAPFDGVVTDRLVNLGEATSFGQPVVRLLQLRGRELEADVPTGVIGSARSAGQLSFDFDGQAWPVALRTVLPQIDLAAGTQRLRLLFLDVDADLPAVGAAGRLRWRSAGARLPAHLVVERDGALGVFVVEAGQARFAAISGAVSGQPADASGLAPDAQLVIDGRYSLGDAQPVVVVGN